MEKQSLILIGIIIIIAIAFGGYFVYKDFTTKTQSPIINQINPTPSSSGFSASPPSGAAPLVVQFNRNSIACASDINIDYGDGTSCTTANPDNSEHCSVFTHTYKKPGTYTAKAYCYMSPYHEVGNTIVTVTATPLPTNQPVNLKTYTNSQYGFSFQYPASLNSSFATFQQQPSAIISATGSLNIDDKGCYRLDIQGFESNGTVNGIPFCESSGGSPGAGQLYSSYYYTTKHGGNYITLTYIVHTPNGCDAYKGSANYQSCVDFFNNINTIVLQPIRDSAATLTFTK